MGKILKQPIFKDGTEDIIYPETDVSQVIGIEDYARSVDNVTLQPIDLSAFLANYIKDITIREVN